MSYRPSAIIAVLCLAACLAAAGSYASPLGQDTSTATAAAPVPPGAKRIADAVSSRFRVLPVQNGIVLVPISRIQGVDNIELRDGTIAVNGHPATGGEVRQLLGRDAGPVLELSYLDLDLQQRLLLPGGEAAAPRERRSQEATEPTPPDRTDNTAAPEVPERSFRRQVETRVRIGGNITVDADEQVNGPVVAVFGSVTVNGRVRDNVVAVGGDVRLGPSADVRGDVVAVGGQVHAESASNVSGKVSEVTIPAIRVRPWSWNPHVMPWFDGAPWRGIRLMGSVLRMAFFTLLTTLVLLLAPRAVQRVEYAVSTQPWTAAAVGLLAQLFFVPVLVIGAIVLAVSIIGIPLLVLVPFVVLAFLAALLLGFTGAVSGLARIVQHRFDWSRPTSFSMLLVGLAIVWSMTLFGRFVAFGGGPFAMIAVLLVFVGVVIEYAVWTVGLGGALLTRFGRYGALPVTVPPIPPDAPFEDARKADDIPPLS